MEHSLQLTAERSVAREALKGIIWTIFFHRLFGPITPTTSEFLDVSYPMATNLPDLDSLIDERIAELIKDYFDTPSAPNPKHKPAASSSASTSIATATTTPTATLSENTHLNSPSTSPLASDIIPNPATSPSGDNVRFKRTETITDIRYGQIVVQFLDKTTTTKKKAGWFGQSKSDSDSDLKPWEIWTINVKCLPLDVNHATTSSANDYFDMSDKKSTIAATVDSFKDTLLQVIDIADTRKDHIPPITSLESSPFPYTIKVKRDKPLSNDDASWGQYIKKILD